VTQEGPQRRAFIAAEEKNSATCAEWEEGVTEIFHTLPESLQNKHFSGKPPEAASGAPLQSAA